MKPTLNINRIKNRNLMGYFVKGKEFAALNPNAAQVSLSANPNFVQFESNHSTALPAALQVSITMKDGIGYKFEDVASLPANEEAVVLPKDETLEGLVDYIDSQTERVNPYTTYFQDGEDGAYYRFVNYTRFAFEGELNEVSHWFQGIDAVMQASGAYQASDYTYLLADTPLKTAQNLREALLKCPFIRDNFKVSIGANITQEDGSQSGIIEQGAAIRLVALGVGSQYNMNVKYESTDYQSDFDNFISISGTDYKPLNPDSIKEGGEACEIQLDIYTDTGIKLGEADNPDMTDLGIYRTTLSKSYNNAPLWFDVNTIHSESYRPPFEVDGTEVKKRQAGKWFDTGTVSDRRFVAKRITPTLSESFYYSPVLYTLTGHGRSLDANDLSDYIVDIASPTKGDGSLARPLTHQPELRYVRGETQYFNFILSNARNAANDTTIGLEYELLSQSGRPLGRFVNHQQSCSALDTVNSIVLDIDPYIDLYPNLGVVRLHLVSDGKVLTEDQVYNILPDDMFRVNDFAFLNALGGWSAFNFGDQAQLDFKATPSTFFRNQTPDSKLYDSIETVRQKTKEERFTVRTMPVSIETADWLKEISSSIAVYELNTCRYVVVDELNVKYTTQDNFVRLEMKYHYSDSSINADS